MRFSREKRGRPPQVIIISLIDILLVLLIFLTVTTTFKQHPAIQLTLPESTQAKSEGADANLVVTVAQTEPFFYLGPRPVTMDRLKEELAAAAERDASVVLSIRADEKAPFGKIITVMDFAKEAGIRVVSASTEEGKEGR